MEAINDIILSGSNIGQSLNERLESINNNFTEIGTNSFLKGDKGDNVGVVQVNLGSVDPNTKYRIRNISNSVTASGLKREIQNAISDNFESSTLGQSIGGHNWNDNLSEGSIYLLYDSKNGNEYNIISSIPYTHIDARFQNINSDTEHEHFNGMVDTSGIIYIDDNGIQFNQPFPTLYYNNLDAPEDKQGQSGFFWKINGEKTGIRADGPQGKNGKDSTWGIVRVGDTYTEGKDYAISAVWDETATSDKWKTGSEDINKILTNSQRVVGIIGEDNEKHQYSMFFGVAVQTTDGFTVNITDNNRVPNVFSRDIFDEITESISGGDCINVGSVVKLYEDKIIADYIQPADTSLVFQPKVGENEVISTSYKFQMAVPSISISDNQSYVPGLEICPINSKPETGFPSDWSPGVYNPSVWIKTSGGTFTGSTHSNANGCIFIGDSNCNAYLFGTSRFSKHSDQAAKLVTVSGSTITNAAVGSATEPVYFSEGKPVKCGSTIGSTNKPVYILNGVITECNAVAATEANKAINVKVTSPASSSESGYLPFTTNISDSQTLHATGNIMCKKVSNTWQLQCAGGFYETSDETLKNFGDDVSIDFEKLANLPKKHFTWKSDEEGLNLQIGTSAQAVKELYPEIVSGEEGSYSVAYDKLSIIALAAIDKLYAQNKQKDEEIQLLKQEIAVIKQMINDKL